MKLTSGIQLNDLVTIEYVARLKNGQIVLTSFNDGPLTFKVGHYQKIKGFNKVIIGMKVGERRDCIVNPRDAFGPIIENLIFPVSIWDLPDNLKIGMCVSNHSRHTSFTILDINEQDSEVILDANHILAGQVLKFSITILEINTPPSSNQELALLNDESFFAKEA